MDTGFHGDQCHCTIQRIERQSSLLQTVTTQQTYTIYGEFPLVLNPIKSHHLKILFLLTLSLKVGMLLVTNDYLSFSGNTGF